MSNLSELKPIPAFKNEAEERDFWLTHDSVDYVDWSKAQQGHFENLKRTPNAVTRKIYFRYFLHKFARILQVSSVFLLALSSLYALFTHKLIWNEAYMHILVLTVTCTFIFENLDDEHSLAYKKTLKQVQGDVN